jgi:hypothetical protein
MEEGANGLRATVIMPGEVATPLLKKRPVPPPHEEIDRMLRPEDLGATSGSSPGCRRKCA